VREGQKAVRAVALAVACATLAGCQNGGGGNAAPGKQHASRPVASDHHRGAGASAAAQRSAVTALIRSGMPIYCGGAQKPYAAFTFDDGPGPYTPLALRILRHAHVPATFFLVGRNVVPFRKSARREARSYALANHTFTHPVLPALPLGAIQSELQRTSDEIRSQTGVSVDLFRPPYEARNAIVDATAQRLGLLEILWNVDSADSAGANYAQIARNVARGISNGAIVLMHENRGQTIRALKFYILPALRKRHIRLVTVPQLLALDPPSAAQVKRGRNGCRYHGLTTAGG
jgi:peptidoglycan/xylan/chitin deacetylase (PgdA/CDA1 family)